MTKGISYLGLGQACWCCFFANLMIWNKGFFGKERALIPNHEVCKVDQGERIALCEEFGQVGYIDPKFTNTQ
jgi:hypothetical protein